MFKLSTYPHCATASSPFLSPMGRRMCSSFTLLVGYALPSRGDVFTCCTLFDRVLPLWMYPPSIVRDRRARLFSSLLRTHQPSLEFPAVCVWWLRVADCVAVDWKEFRLFCLLAVGVVRNGATRGSKFISVLSSGVCAAIDSLLSLLVARCRLQHDLCCNWSLLLADVPPPPALSKKISQHFQLDCSRSKRKTCST